jgi:type IV pilus assembly protein PilQ
MMRGVRSGTVTLLLALLLPAASGLAAESKKRTAKPEAAPTKPADSESRFVGETISLDLKDADLKDVLRTFAELTRLNIAVDPDVTGSVTVRLREVPWDQALDLILRMNGLGYVLEGKILRIGKTERLVSDALS